jgi:hypothetical protein
VLHVTRHLAVSPEGAWDALTDLDDWPKWGPFIVAARLDGGGRRLHDGAVGQVQTPIGAWLTFRVTGWQEGCSWAWSVAHIPATGHRLEPRAQGGAAATIDVPLWAAPYAPICWVALGRLERLVAGGGKSGVSQPSRGGRPR